MIVSAGSKFDRVKAGQATFNASEQNGYEIFQSKCESCHKEPLFTDLSFRNNGMELNTVHNDFGRMEITGNKNDSLKFKVPSLRNIALSGYYTHDGRFSAFSAVLNHYSDGIVNSPTLDPALANKIPLTDLEKFYLQEFMFTLSDSTLINNPDFSKP
jgi:cytochrome c peroxidase